MNEICQAHFNTGWNDTAHGILTWTEGLSVLDWAIYIKELATVARLTAKEDHNQAYYDGVIACVDFYKGNGYIERK